MQSLHPSRLSLLKRSDCRVFRQQQTPSRIVTNFQPQGFPQPQRSNIGTSTSSNGLGHQWVVEHAHGNHPFHHGHQSHDVSLAFTPAETYDRLAIEGYVRANLPLKQTLIQAFIAGCYVSFGGTLCTTVGAACHGMYPGMERFVFGAIGFPLSILMVTVAGGSAFTPNLALLTAALIQKKATLMQAIKVWTTTYLGCFAGTMLMALMVNGAQMACLPGCAHVALHKLSLPFHVVFLRGVGGGWLICLAMLMATAAKDIVSKAVVIWFPISTYAACGWEHCLANMFFVGAAVFAGTPGATWLALFRDSLLPSTLGNMVGGCLFVALFYAVAHDKVEQKVAVVKEVEEIEAEEEEEREVEKEVEEYFRHTHTVPHSVLNGSGPSKPSSTFG